MMILGQVLIEMISKGILIDNNKFYPLVIWNIIP